MQYKRHWMFLCGIVAAAMMALSFAGCAKKAVTNGPTAAPGNQQVVSETKTPAAAPAKTEAKPEAKGTGLVTEYVVKKGESLWWISKYKDIYDDPYLWPIIYQANKDQIKKANLIYPGQKLKIPRSGFTMEDLEKARKQAGAKKPYKPSKDSRPPVN